MLWILFELLEDNRLNAAQYFGDGLSCQLTFGEDEVYNQADATGFITLFGLPLTVRALMKQKKLK